MPGLRVHNIHKAFGPIKALRGVSFEVNQGEILAILGPSGCGKSTLLMIIAGLEKPDDGEIYWDDHPLRTTPPHLRGFGLMFQDYALFPHLNVFDNIAFGLRMIGMEKKKIRIRVMEVLELVNLRNFENRDVNTLSGGEQQRVALARALAPQPRLLMLDEPLGSLDRNLREQLLSDLRQILRKMRQTAIYVTHDQEEAFAIADRITLMNEGAIEQIGSPQELYRHPKSKFVAHFLGLTNLLEGEIIFQDGKYFAQTPIGLLPLPFTKPSRDRITILLRPDHIHLNNTKGYQLQGTVIDISFRGGICRTTVLVKERQLSFDFPSNIPLPKVGDIIFLSFNPHEALQILDE